MIDLPAPIAVVCHDAGATNLILSWIDPANKIRPVMEGPAAQLWKQRFAGTELRTLGDALDDAAALLSGTGWGSDLEHRARRMARDARIRSVAVIDHWVNYGERFVRGAEQVLPDEIWVTDEDALAIARREFPNLRVELKPNLYLQEQLVRARPLADEDRDVLFITEPMRSDWGRGTPGEFQSLEYFLSNRGRAGIPREACIRIRPHPADELGKYESWLGGAVTLDRSPNIGAALDGVRWVVGCQSYALFVALKAGRTVISAIPPWAPPCRLPQNDIVHLARL